MAWWLVHCQIGGRGHRQRHCFTTQLIIDVSWMMQQEYAAWMHLVSRCSKIDMEEFLASSKEE